MTKQYLILILSFTLAGCVDFDPFGTSTRTIIEPYEMLIWEDGATYYLSGPSHIEGGWGALDGTVNQIGWDKNIIIVLQNDDGQGAGWRIVDAKSTSVSKLYSDKEFRALLDLERFNVSTADQAWRKLQ